MDTVMRICGVVFCALAAALLLRDRHRAVAAVCVSLAIVTALVYCASSQLSGFTETLNRLSEGGGFADYAVTLTKALGIAYVTGAATEVCKSCGEGGLAYAVNLGGRAELLLLALPMVSKLLGIASEILG